MCKLGVNIDHIATIRQARQAIEPDPVAAALLAELAGADGITVHLRGDRRHIQDSDVRRLRECITTRLNIEMAPTDEMVRIALRFKPEQVTLVPEKEGEVTTEGGLDVLKNRAAIDSALRRLKRGGIQVSLFIDPESVQIDAAAELEAPLVELNTRAFAESCPKGIDVYSPVIRKETDKIRSAALRGSSKGLRILAGHGLTYRNVGLITEVREIEELNIGHNIIARAVLVGMERAVREMLQAMNG